MQIDDGPPPNSMFLCGHGNSFREGVLDLLNEYFEYHEQGEGREEKTI